MNKYLYCEIIDDMIVTCYHRDCPESTMTYHYQLINQNGVVESYDSADYVDSKAAFENLTESWD